MNIVKTYSTYQKIMGFIIDVISLVVLYVVVKFVIDSVIGYYNSPDRTIISFIMYIKQSINEKALLYVGPFVFVLVADRAYLALKNWWSYIKRKA